MKNKLSLILLIVVIITLTLQSGCKSNFTLAEAREKYPCPPPNKPIVIDSTYTIDSTIVIQAEVFKDTIYLFDTYEDFKVISEDNKRKVVARITKDSVGNIKNIIYETIYKEREVTIKQPNVQKFLSTIKSLKINVDSLNSLLYDERLKLSLKNKEIDGFKDRLSEVKSERNWLIVAFVGILILLGLIFVLKKTKSLPFLL